MGRFEGKIVLVTGAGDGIGRQTAMEFAKEGATIIISDRNVEAGQKSAGIVGQLNGGKAEFVPADVSKESEIAALFAHIKKTYGRLDVAVNNAGTEGQVALVDEQTNENFEHVIGVNVFGTFLCLREEARLMKAQGSGVIINFASIAAHVGFAGLSVYTASKAAVMAMTKSAALELIPAGVRVCSISPGLVDTAMAQRFFDSGEDVKKGMVAGIPLGRMCTPLEIARGVLFAASEDGALLVGQTLNLDGGWAHVKS
jgi:NAD(P)-dependent dehydrogenase (short-subunit alcohol dehydrogenase family)